MKVVVLNNYEELSYYTSNIIINQINNKPNSILGLPTGNTPLRMYELLVKKYNNNQITFKDVISFNLDEYVGLDKNNINSYHYYMYDNLFNHIDIDKNNIHIPEDVNKYKEELKKYDIDLMILGLGQNGHIGFNEPGKEFVRQTHIVNLSENTKEVNSKLFKKDKIPDQAITIGIEDIFKAKKILIMVSGKSKKKIVKQLLYSDITPTLPATILLLHSDCTLIVDKDAIEES